MWEKPGKTDGKHRVLRAYLDAWLPIMGSSHDKIVIVDGFAGPGEYKHGEPGSPQIMLRALVEHEQINRIKAEVVFLFIEKREDRADYLRQLVEELMDEVDLPDNLEVGVGIEAGDFEKVFGEIVGHIEKRGRVLAPTFVFIDPFGYAQATMEFTDRFLRFYGCEVLIYVPLPHIYRFTTAKKRPERALDAFFGTERWREVTELDRDERLGFLHDLFLEQLRSVGRVQYVRSFEIKGKGFNGYHLFFGTGHEQGLRKMKEAMWSVDPVAGESYEDSTDLDNPVLFTEEADTAPLLAALKQKFGTEPFSIEDAKAFTLFETPYIEKHIKKLTLKPEEQEGRLEYVGGVENRKAGTYPDGAVVRFTED